MHGSARSQPPVQIDRCILVALAVRCSHRDSVPGEPFEAIGSFSGVQAVSTESLVIRCVKSATQS
jgi:hypothetical protein